MCQGVDFQPLLPYDTRVNKGELLMKCIITQMTHEWMDTPVSQLSDNTLMILKHELLQKVCELSNEMADRAEAEESVS